MFIRRRPGMMNGFLIGLSILMGIPNSLFTGLEEFPVGRFMVKGSECCEVAFSTITEYSNLALIRFF